MTNHSWTDGCTSRRCARVGLHFQRDFDVDVTNGENSLTASLVATEHPLVVHLFYQVDFFVCLHDADGEEKTLVKLLEKAITSRACTHFDVEVFDHVTFKVVESDRVAACLRVVVHVFEHWWRRRWN